MALDAIGGDTLERLLARDPKDVERILPVDDAQRDLTEQHIVPVLPQLEAEFLAMDFQILRNTRYKPMPV